MKHEDAQVPPADAGRLETPVRPDAWWARAENGNIRAWTSAHAESLRLAEEVGFQLEPLYSRAALDAAVAAERERWLEMERAGKAYCAHLEADGCHMTSPEYEAFLKVFGPNDSLSSAPQGAPGVS